MTKPVLIVGAGPVGLAAGCELLSLGVPVRILDAAADRPKGTRALQLWPLTRRTARTRPARLRGEPRPAGADHELPPRGQPTPESRPRLRQRTPAASPGADQCPAGAAPGGTRWQGRAVRRGHPGRHPRRRCERRGARSGRHRDRACRLADRGGRRAQPGPRATRHPVRRRPPPDDLPARRGQHRRLLRDRPRALLLRPYRRARLRAHAQRQRTYRRRGPREHAP